MKTFKIAFLLSAIGLMFFQISCDKIEQPFVELVSSDTVTSGGPGDTNLTVRKVLLEDYTGHKCPNCPEAATEANSLLAKYGEQLIVLTIHAGFYSPPDPDGHFTYDFRTPEGGTLHDYYQLFYYPAGVVNRVQPEWAGFISLGKGDWDQAIGDLVNQPQEADIKITSVFNTHTSLLETKIETEFHHNQDGIYNIVVYVVESHIEKPQESQAGVIEHYIHDHVLRTSMNGTWGTPVGGNGNATTGHIITDNFTLTLDDEWVPENVHVIAVVFQQDHETRRVVQAEELHIID